MRGAFYSLVEDRQASILWVGFARGFPGKSHLLSTLFPGYILFEWALPGISLGSPTFFPLFPRVISPLGGLCPGLPARQSATYNFQNKKVARFPTLQCLFFRFNLNILPFYNYINIIKWLIFLFSV